MTNWPDDKAYSLVKAEMEAGKPLTLAMIGDVFGPDAWCLIVNCLMDAGDAARAIQGSINRLNRMGGIDDKE